MEEIDLEVEKAETPQGNYKELVINQEENKYICQIQANEESLHVSLYENNIIKYTGNIHISRIQYNLRIYDFHINDIFEEINELNNNKFNIIKGINIFKLKIEFIIINKKRYIYIDLNEVKKEKEKEKEKENNNDYIKKINELKEIIKIKDNKIKSLEDELNKYKSYDNFDIKSKEPKYILNSHTGAIRCSTVLKDGRIATGSYDNSIIIYNKETFKPDLIIKEHNNHVNSIIQLNSGELASCSKDNTIKLYNISENEYNIIQTLTEHKDTVNKIIELKNNKLVSCSLDKNIIFYNKDNHEYKKEYSFTTNGPNGPIIQTKDNEICYHEQYNKVSYISFYDINKKKSVDKIKNINISNYSTDCLLMITKDLLIITGTNKISIINVNKHKLIKTIDATGSESILVSCLLNKDTILTGDENKRIIQWKIGDNNLSMISIKENAHDEMIFTLLKIGSSHLLSGGSDNLAKIW